MLYPLENFNHDHRAQIAAKNTVLCSALYSHSKYGLIMHKIYVFTNKNYIILVKNNN